MRADEAEDSGVPGGKVTVRVRTRVLFPRREVCTDLGRVRVSPISRPGCPQRETAIAVETAQPEETAPCSDSTLHSDIPIAYGVRVRHAL